MGTRAARLIGLTAALAAGVAALGAVAAARPTSAAPVPVLVELFTSEGCSSCPPADQLLIDLLARQPVPGALVIGLSEHVDYWDELGWRDPFANALFTRRQNTYADTHHSSDVYTPQVFVDGGIGLVGSDRNNIVAAITRAASRPKADVKLSWHAPVLTVSIPAQPDSADSPVWLAITESGLSSTVKRGENAGHVLRHDNVVRRLTQIGKTGKDGAFAAEVPAQLDARWNADAIKFVVFTQRSDLSRPTAVASIAGR
jgi:hypothetical protein